MPLRSTFWSSLLLFGGSLLLFVSASCTSPESGVKLYPVRGKVLLDDKPTEGATVFLYAVNPSPEVSKLAQPPSAAVKADGSFAIGTLAPEDGAPVGDYKVSIQWLPPDARTRIAEGSGVSNLMPGTYGDPKTSGLQIQVKAEPNEVPPFKLKSKK